MITRAAARAFSTSGLKVVNDVAKQQFLLKVHSDEAVLSYEKSGKDITFNDTNVPEVFQGKGVGKILAKYAFDYAVENNLNVTNQCSFLAKYYAQNKHNYKSLKYKDDVQH